MIFMSTESTSGYILSLDMCLTFYPILLWEGGSMKTLASNFTLGNKLLFVLNYEETIRLHEKTSIDVMA